MRFSKLTLSLLFTALISQEHFDSRYPICEAIFPDSENVTDILVKFIAQETRAIKIAIFYLSESRIISALMDAKRRNVDVQIIIDKGCITNLTIKKFQLMLGAGIQISVFNSHSVYKFKPLMHNKYCIFESRSIVWTGSFNFTFAAQRFNKENVLIIENAKITDKYKTNFLKIKQNTTPLKEYMKFRKLIKKHHQKFINSLVKDKLNLVQSNDITLIIKNLHLN